MGTVGIVPALRDGPLRDQDGLLLGRVEDVLYDAQTNRAAWLVVRLSDGPRTLAPARGMRFGTDGLALGVAASDVRSCPVALVTPAPLREHVAAAGRHYGARRFARGEAFTSVAAARDVSRAA